MSIRNVPIAVLGIIIKSILCGNLLKQTCCITWDSKYFTRGQDEVIGKSSIWLKLYLVKLLNISRKVSKRVLQNMNKEKKIWWLMVGGLTTKSQVLSFLHSKSGINCKYLFLGYGVPAFRQHPMIYPSR